MYIWGVDGKFMGGSVYIWGVDGKFMDGSVYMWGVDGKFTCIDESAYMWDNCWDICWNGGILLE